MSGSVPGLQMSLLFFFSDVILGKKSVHISVHVPKNPKVLGNSRCFFFGKSRRLKSDSSQGKPDIVFPKGDILQAKA